MGQSVELRHVSFHAVTRYCQRVLGTPVVADEAALGTYACAQAHCRAAGMSISEVRAAILHPVVQAAIYFGVPYVQAHGLGMQIDPANGVVLTIYSGKGSETGPRKRLSAKSQREARRYVQAHHRRIKRSPAARSKP